MANQSALYKLYADRLARCSSPDELIKSSQEIRSKDFRPNEKTALVLSAMFIARQFDKAGKKPKKGVSDEIPEMDCKDQQ